MILITIITVLVIFFIIVDLIPIYMHKKTRLFWTYVTILTFAYTLCVLFGLEYKIPSPSEAIKKMVIAVLEYIN